jgi:uncharacterized protein YjbI with pentapeptide repeats
MKFIFLALILLSTSYAFSMDGEEFLSKCHKGDLSSRQTRTLETILGSYYIPCEMIWNWMMDQEEFHHYEWKDNDFMRDTYDLDFILNLLENSSKLKRVTLQLRREFDYSKYKVLKNLEELVLIPHSHTQYPLQFDFEHNIQKISLHINKTSPLDIEEGTIAELLEARLIPGKAKTVSMIGVKFKYFGDFEKFPSLKGIEVIGQFEKQKLFLANSQTLESISVNDISDWNGDAWSGNGDVEVILGNSPKLKSLSLQNLHMRSLPDLSQYKQLQKLDLKGNLIGDISFANKNTKLRELNLSRNVIEGDSFIGAFNHSSLFTLARLSRLDISNSGIRSIIGLDSFFKLRGVNLAGNPLQDISVLGSMPFLEEIDLSNSKINSSQITHLADHPWLKKLSLKNITTLDLSSLKGVPNLTLLDLEDTQIDVFKIPETLPALTDLKLNEFDLMTVDSMMNLPLLTTLQVRNHQYAAFYDRIKFKELNLNNPNEKQLKELCKLASVDQLLIDNLNFDPKCLPHIVEKIGVLKLSFDDEKVKEINLPSSREKLEIVSVSFPGSPGYPVYFEQVNYKIKNIEFLNSIKTLSISNLKQKQFSVEGETIEHFDMRSFFGKSVEIDAKNLKTFVLFESKIKSVDFKNCQSLKKVNLRANEELKKVTGLNQCAIEQYSGYINSNTLAQLEKSPTLRTLWPSQNFKTVVCSKNVTNPVIKEFCQTCSGKDPISADFPAKCNSVFKI